MTDASTPPLSGRRAQAAVNDRVILESARAVFIDDPTAPIAAVARQAGVGISALYRRYPSKEDLLRTLCGDGLQRFIDQTRAALADEREPWTVFADFMRRAVEADTNSLTDALAGTFTPTPDLWAQAALANELMVELFDRIRAAGVLRAGIVVHDLSVIFELLAAVRLGSPARTRELRQRYLALLLEALHRPSDDPVPGPAPRWEELTGRWGASSVSP